MPLENLFTYIKSRKDQRMDHCHTPVRMATQELVTSHFKTALCFQLVKSLFSMLMNEVSTYTVLTHIVNQSSMSDFIKDL